MICGGMHEQFQVVNKKIQLFTTESFYWLHVNNYVKFKKAVK